MALTIEWRDGRPVALKGGEEVGRVEVIFEEPVLAYMVNPRAVKGEDAVLVSRALLEAGVDEALRRGCAKVEVILEDRIPHLDALDAAMRRWGHRPIRTKLLFSRGIEDLPRLPDGGLCFSLIEGPEDPRLLTVLRDVFNDGATEAREGQTAEKLVEELLNLCRHSDPDGPSSWELALEADELVGAVLPGFVDPGIGSNLFVAVTPRARGRGHGLRLHLRGNLTSVRRGVEQLLGSCEADNEPMARIFRRLGYKQKHVQHYFEWCMGKGSRKNKFAGRRALMRPSSKERGGRILFWLQPTSDAVGRDAAALESRSYSCADPKGS